MSILAIDLGQSKSVFVFGGNKREERFGSFNTNSGAVRKILMKHRPTLVVIEICPLAAMVYDIGRELGMPVLVADTTQDAWSWRNVKRKTDRDDALKLLRLAMVDQINPVHIPPVEVRQWRGLLKAREAAVVAQTRCKIRIRALLATADRKLTRGKGGWTLAGVDELRQWSRALAECSPQELWRGTLAIELEHLELLNKHVDAFDSKLQDWAKTDRRLQLVSTIPGVGTVTAATIVAVLDNPHRFRSRRQVASYAGLTPRRYQSGQMDHQGRISKRGNAMLRRMLNQAAWVSVRYAPSQREFYLRLSNNGQKGKRKRAVVAVMHKLLVTAWAILRDERPYQAPRSDAAASAA